MTRKKDIAQELDKLKNQSETSSRQMVYYEHPETGDLYDRFKTVVEDPNGLVIRMPFTGAPFVVKRQKAESEGWEIVQSIPNDGYGPSRDLVEVSEWCINPWVDNPAISAIYTITPGMSPTIKKKIVV
jgi:hypothetical protein